MYTVLFIYICSTCDIDLCEIIVLKCWDELYNLFPNVRASRVNRWANKDDDLTYDDLTCDDLIYDDLTWKKDDDPTCDDLIRDDLTCREGWRSNIWWSNMWRSSIW